MDKVYGLASCGYIAAASYVNQLIEQIDMKLLEEKEGDPRKMSLQ